MIRNLSSKKDIILDAALRLVSEKNSLNITIREISSAAKVNVAAINYYFQSKEHLFKEMERLFIDNFVDAFTPLDDESLTKESRLYCWIKKAISYGTHYPGMLIFLKRKFQEDSESAVELKLKMMMRIAQLRQLFIDVTEPKAEDADQLFLAFGALLIFPFIADNYIPGIDIIKDEEVQFNSIKTLINKLKREVVK